MNNIPWENCIALGVDNTSVNVCRHNSLIVEARKRNEHIQILNLPNLESQRKIRKCVLVYKSLNGLIPEYCICVIILDSIIMYIIITLD